MVWILIKRRLGSQCPDYILTSFIFYAFFHNLCKVFIHIFSFRSSVMNSPPWNADSNVKWFKLHPSHHFTTWLNAAFVLFQMKSVWVCMRACVRMCIWWTCMLLHASHLHGRVRTSSLHVDSKPTRAVFNERFSDLSPPYDFPFFTFQTLLWEVCMYGTAHCVYKKPTFLE